MICQYRLLSSFWVQLKLLFVDLLGMSNLPVEKPGEGSKIESMAAMVKGFFAKDFTG